MGYLHGNSNRSGKGLRMKHRPCRCCGAPVMARHATPLCWRCDLDFRQYWRKVEEEKTKRPADVWFELMNKKDYEEAYNLLGRVVTKKNMDGEWRVRRPSMVTMIMDFEWGTSYLPLD